MERDDQMLRGEEALPEQENRNPKIQRPRQSMRPFMLSFRQPVPEKPPPAEPEDRVSDGVPETTPPAVSAGQPDQPLYEDRTEDRSVPVHEPVLLDGMSAEDADHGMAPGDHAPVVARSVDVPVPRVPLQFKTLGEAMDSIRELHPLPAENFSSQENYQITWLLTQIRKISTNEELERFAFSLGRKDLGILFSALSNLKKREETEPVQNLIRFRASRCLYLYGWITFQYCYPRSTVARALADLCTILEDLSFVREREKNRSDERALSALPAVSIGNERVLWNRVPLISGISFPNSRHFISDIANHIFESKISLGSFFNRYAIFADLPFGRAVEERYNEKMTGVAPNPFLSGDFFDRFRS